jgi:hypothetical protein
MPDTSDDTPFSLVVPRRPAAHPVADAATASRQLHVAWRQVVAEEVLVVRGLAVGVAAVHPPARRDTSPPHTRLTPGPSPTTSRDATCAHSGSTYHRPDLAVRVT